MKTKDGGPAFSRACFGNDEFSDDGAVGMSLRDYFAAKAMQAIVGKYGVISCQAGKERTREACEVSSNSDSQHLPDMSHAGEAWIAYEYADAMLAAREAKT